MNRFLTWLLDLQGDLFAAEGPLVVEWVLPVPAWFLLGMALLAAAGVVMVYGREQVSMPRRVAMIALRLCLVAVIIAALCRPALVLQRNRVEPAYVVVLMDRSLSMSGKDHYDQDTTEALAQAVGAGPVRVEDMSRLEIAKAVLTRNEYAPLQQLLLQNGIQLLSFAEDGEPLAMIPKGGSAGELGEAIQNVVADGQATNLSAPLDFILNRMQGKRIAAIVLASDGRMTSTVQLDGLLQQAFDKQIPIHPIRIGATRKEVDLEVSSVKAQSVVFANDFLLVEAVIRARGLDQAIPCSVQLVDDQTDEVVHETQMTVNASLDGVTVELTAKVLREGDARYRVQVAPAPDERQLENNVEVVETRVLIDRLKVLYVEGYPRFEYRFLKNALLREKSIELSVLLLEADEHFVQEGAESIRAFPQTAEELARYQVVLLGDVDPNGEWLAAEQMAMLLEFVGDKGGGFGLIAGERHSPHRFLGTPLERLIPVKIDPQVALSSSEGRTTGYRPLLTPTGQDSRILRFYPDAAENEAAIRGLPELYWISRSLGARPGAAVLLIHPDISTASGPMPVIVQGRYGAGKLFFQATDDTWRWRRHTGELLYDGYWVRVMRELMNPSLASGDRRYVIRTDRRTYPYGTSVRAQVEILDPRLISEEVTSLALQVTRPGAADSREEAPGGPTLDSRLPLQRVGPHSNVFEGTFLPGGSGSFTVSVPELSSPGTPSPSATFRVEKPDLELRHPDADHQMLERIAASTGGKLIEPGQLESQLTAIRDRSVQIPDDISESLWDSRLVFLLFVLMISIEWGLRKGFGLI